MFSTETCSGANYIISSFRYKLPTPALTCCIRPRNARQTWYRRLVYFTQSKLRLYYNHILTCTIDHRHSAYVEWRVKSERINIISRTTYAPVARAHYHGSWYSNFSFSGRILYNVSTSPGNIVYLKCNIPTHWR